MQTVLLFNRLARHCNKVFDSFLADWVLKGVLDDRHSEFMIARREHKYESQSTPGDFLESDFYICEEKVPLRYNGIKQSILHIGVILGTLKVIDPSISPFEALTSANIQDDIQRIFLQVNNLVMNTLRSNSNLGLYFDDILNLFFLDRSDFAYELLSFIGNNRQSQSFGLLEYLTKNSSCAIAFGPLKEKLHFRIAEKRFYESLFRVLAVNGGISHQQRLADGKPYLLFPIDSSMIIPAFSVDFPYNCIFSRQCISKYQLLFQYLFKVRSSIVTFTLASISLKSNQLRIMNFSFLCFFKALHFYAMHEIIQPKFRSMQEYIFSVICIHNFRRTSSQMHF